MVKNLPANAGEPGSSPGPGRSHMPREQLSLCATITEACAPRAHAPQKEKQLEKARAQQRRLKAAKNK